MAQVIGAEPYLWPYDGDIDPAKTALILIDWQHDFCGPGGYVDTMGYDINAIRRGVAPTQESAGSLSRYQRTYRDPHSGRP